MLLKDDDTFEVEPDQTDAVELDYQRLSLVQARRLWGVAHSMLLGLLDGYPNVRWIDPMDAQRLHQLLDFTSAQLAQFVDLFDDRAAGVVATTMELANRTTAQAKAGKGGAK